MTVITFAKHGACYSAFDTRTAACRHTERAQAPSGRIALLAATLGAIGVIAIFALGIQTTILTLSMAQRGSQIRSLEEETERLRIEALKVSNPQYITDRAHLLQLVSGTGARYVTLGMPEELAAQYHLPK